MRFFYRCFTPSNPWLGKQAGLVCWPEMPRNTTCCKSVPHKKTPCETKNNYVPQIVRITTKRLLRQTTENTRKYVVVLSPNDMKSLELLRVPLTSADMFLLCSHSIEARHLIDEIHTCTLSSRVSRNRHHQKGRPAKQPTQTHTETRTLSHTLSRAPGEIGCREKRAARDVKPQILPHRRKITAG